MSGNQSNFIQIDKTIAESIADIITKQYLYLNEKQHENASAYMHHVEKKLDKTSISAELFTSIARLLIEKKSYLKSPEDTLAINSFLIYIPKEKPKTNIEKKSPVSKKPWPACRDRNYCQNDSCSFTHPNGKEKKGFDGSTTCKFGDNCTNNKCKFSHE